MLLHELIIFLLFTNSVLSALSVRSVVGFCVEAIFVIEGLGKEIRFAN